jgi:hypothetical protein
VSSIKPAQRHKYNTKTIQIQKTKHKRDKTKNMVAVGGEKRGSTGTKTLNPEKHR